MLAFTITFDSYPSFIKYADEVKFKRLHSSACVNTKLETKLLGIYQLDELNNEALACVCCTYLISKFVNLSFEVQTT